MFTDNQKVVVTERNHRMFGEVGTYHADKPLLMAGTVSVEFAEGKRYRFFESELVGLDERLEALRATLRDENISLGELIELQGYAAHIDAGDVELLEAAGVPEFPEEDYTGRRVEWTDPDGGEVHGARVASHNSEDDTFDLLLDNGGEAGAHGHELHFI